MSGVPVPIQKLRREAIRARTRLFLLHQRHFGRVCFIHINKCGGTSVERALGLPLIHDTALQRIERVGRARWEEMLSFALVRHPYAKAVSHYKYRRKTGQAGMKGNDIDLNTWIEKAYGERDPRYYNNPLMFQPCLDWLVDRDGTILVKRVLKLEEIGTTWPAFCNEAFGRTIPLPHSNATRPRSSPSHTSADLTKEARAVLREHFARDFAQFGYDA